ncbi:MAG: Hsp20/alpha crystallin family protein [Alphaproteobacteria bacterium]
MFGAIDQVAKSKEDHMLRYSQGRDVWADPILNLQRMQEEMNRLFGRFGTMTEAGEYPSMNVWTGEEGAMVTAEVPGVSPENIEVTVHRNTLTLKGRRDEAAPTGEEVTYHRRERDHGTFGRTIALPFPVDSDRVEASFRNGVVKILLPRPEADKPRRIKISNA